MIFLHPKNIILKATSYIVYVYINDANIFKQSSIIYTHIMVPYDIIDLCHSVAIL